MERDDLKLSFALASERVLNLVRSEIPLSSWMITRVMGDEWIMVAVNDPVYGIERGMSFRWTDSFCFQMVQGRGPHVAAQAQAVEVYRRAAVNLVLHIESYVGLPIHLSDRTLFGTLCAIDPLERELDLKRTLKVMRAAVRSVERSLNSDLRALNDALERSRSTSVPNSEAACGCMSEDNFRSAVEIEERLCAEFGDRCVVGVVVFDGDIADKHHLIGEGVDEQRSKGVMALRRAINPVDLLGDFGSGVITILFLGKGREDVLGLRRHLETILRGSGVRAKVSLVERRRDETTSQSLERALVPVQP